MAFPASPYCIPTQESALAAILRLKHEIDEVPDADEKQKPEPEDGLLLWGRGL